eukprot:COSAG06_NODE_10013_length_1768_cov_1.253445_2_plen_260_part_01
MADDVGLLSPASVNSSTALLSPAPDSGGSSTPGTLLATLGTPPPTTAAGPGADADALMQMLAETPPDREGSRSPIEVLMGNEEESLDQSEATLSAAQARHPIQPVIARYRSVGEGKIRAEVSKKSADAGKLKKGEILEVTEKAMDGEIERVKFARGWASVLAASGKVLLEELPVPPAPAPAPAPESAAAGQAEKQSKEPSATTPPEPRAAKETAAATVPEVSAGAAESVGVRYKVLAAATVRKGKEMNSDPVMKDEKAKK